MLGLVYRRRRRHGATNSPPNQPSITAGTPTSSGAPLTGNAFSDPDVGDTHAASQWQVTTAADTGYASPVISTGDDATNKTSYAATGLSASTSYIARVRYKDSAGNYSAWSTSASFTTSAAASVTLNTPTTGAMTSAGTSATVTHTVPAGAKYLEVRVVNRANGLQTVSSCVSDVDGALTQVQTGFGSADFRHYVFLLTNPTAGAHTITVTLSASASRMTLSAMSVSGATSQTSAVNTDGGSTGTAPSVTIASAAGALVVASISNADATNALTCSETLLVSTAATNDTIGCREKLFSKAGAASVNVAGTLAAADGWVAIAVAYAT